MQYDYETGLKGSIEDYYRPLDFSLVFGVEANLPKNIDLTVRYVRGLTSVYAPGGYNYQCYNNYLQFTAGYRFEREQEAAKQIKNKHQTKKMRIKFNTLHMNKLPYILLMTAFLFSACKRYSKYEGVAFTEKEPRDWENPEMFNQNREAPHATMISFADELSALEADKLNSPNLYIP